MFLKSCGSKRHNFNVQVNVVTVVFFFQRWAMYIRMHPWTDIIQVYIRTTKLYLLNRLIHRQYGDISVENTVIKSHHHHNHNLFIFYVYYLWTCLIRINFREKNKYVHTWRKSNSYIVNMLRFSSSVCFIIFVKCGSI